MGLAQRLERSKNWIVKQALQEEERRRLTLEALEDVDNGRLVSHQAVMAWGTLNQTIEERFTEWGLKKSHY